MAAEAEVDLRFVASLVASQLPREVEAKIEGTVTGIEGYLESAASRKLLVDIKRELNGHGHPLNKGNRDLERIVKVASVSEQLTQNPLIQAKKLRQMLIAER